MIDLAGYSYATNKACIVCRDVLDGAPVLAFAHDAGGDLHFACSREDHNGSDWLVVGLEHIDLAAHGLDRLPTMHAGSEASRRSINAPWETAEFTNG